MSNEHQAQETDAEIIELALTKKIKAADGRTHTKLHFHEPEMTYALDAEDEVTGVNRQTLFVMARMCKLDYGDMCKISPRDFQAALLKLSAWLGNPVEDGENSPS